MGWEPRRRGRSFFGFFWIGGRSQRIDFGDGPPAQQAADIYEAWRYAGETNRKRIDEIKQQARTLDGFVVRYSLLASYLVAAVLTAAGYSQNSGSRWRRARDCNGAPSMAILELDIPLRSAPGLDQTLPRSTVLHAIQAARPPEGYYWSPAIAALENQRHQFGSRDPVAREEIATLLRSRPEIWMDALRFGADAVGVMAEKLATIRSTERTAVIWDSMKIAMDSMPDDNVTCVHAALVMRRVACLLWSEHAGEFFRFVAANFPAGLPYRARQRLTRANHHLNSACRLEKKLQRLLALDELTIVRREAAKSTAGNTVGRPTVSAAVSSTALVRSLAPSAIALVNDEATTG